MTSLKNKYFLALSAFLLAGLFVGGCGDSSRAGASEDPNQITACIQGVVEKGPFVKGTTVTLYELNPESFAQTGKVFNGSVDKDDGSFSLDKVELGSQYVLVEASGYYWNELWGLNSSNTLTLKAIAHLGEKNKLNINIGTHITHKRILALLDSGISFEEAKEQAELELVQTFFGDESGFAFENASIFNNEKMLALSIMILMTGEEADVTEMIADLTAGISPELLLKLADNVAFRYDSYGSARSHMEEKYPEVTIEAFEAYVNNFWQKIYGLSECSKKTAGILDTVRAENSINDGKVLACKELVANSEVFLWAEATDIDISVGSIEIIEDGNLVKSKKDSTVAYVYDSGRWRKAYESEIKIGTACIKSNDGTMIKKKGVDYLCSWNYCFGTDEKYMPDGSPISSANRCSALLPAPSWKQASLLDYEKEEYFNKDIEYGTVKDERDGQSYRTIEIDGKIWMAENLAYRVSEANCANIEKFGCTYSWDSAMDFVVLNTVDVPQTYRGICMENWHIPDTTEWKSLLQKYDVKSLESKIGWNESTNETGFSVIPLKTSYTNFIAANWIEYEKESNIPWSGGTYGYVAVLEDATAFIREMSQSDKNDFRYTQGSVRCVKNPE